MIKNIVIVGGGTAGWITAKTILRHDVNVTLIESKNISPIGVGEGSTPNLLTFLEEFDIDIKKLNSTHKSGVQYINWYANYSSKYNDWFHPFANSDFTKSFEEVMDESKMTDIFYALHFDVELLQNELKDSCLMTNINHIENDVVDCELDKKGNISTVILKDNSHIKGDFFIDCSGFKRVLISKLKPSFVDYSNELLCDRAIATHIDRKNNDSVKPTKAIALSSGWSWDIPLADKTGVGYTYSSQFISDKDAKKEFNDYLGTEKDFKVIKFKSERLKNPLINNCLAIGLSSGFFEPLEATNISFILNQLNIFKCFGKIDISDKDVIKQYNMKNNYLWDYGKEYIFAHYILSKRDDSKFWRYVKNLPKTNLITDILDNYNIDLSQSIFTYADWQYLIVGMNRRKNE